MGAGCFAGAQDGGLRPSRARDRTGRYKIPPGQTVYTCFTSDFFIEEADAWRGEAWAMIRERSDCTFLMITKRIDRVAACLPADWGEGWPHVVLCCTCETQERADYRLRSTSRCRCAAAR